MEKFHSILMIFLHRKIVSHLPFRLAKTARISLCSEINGQHSAKKFLYFVEKFIRKTSEINSYSLSVHRAP